MATLSQIEANRLNAQQSTGPRTPQGKAVSSQNAFKSGPDADSQFCYGEKRADFYTLQIDYFARFQPRSPEERFQVDSLIRNEWMIRRIFRAEAHLWEFHTTRASRVDGVPLGEAFHNANPEFMRLHRRITLFEKSYKDSFAQLQTLQQNRLAAQAQIADLFDPKLFADPPHAPIEEESTDPQIGFVPESTTVGQAPSPAPDPLVRLPEPSQSQEESGYVFASERPPEPPVWRNGAEVSTSLTSSGHPAPSVEISSCPEMRPARMLGHPGSSRRGDISKQCSCVWKRNGLALRP